jgi:hypothetical protein
MARAKQGAKPPPLPKGAKKTIPAPGPAGQLVGGECKVVAIDAVRQHPENARRHDIEGIKKSIRANGFYGRLIVWKQNDLILVGNGRWQAAKELGYTAVPIEVVDVDERTARRMLAVDNRTSDLAGYHDNRLAQLMKALDAEGDLEAAGYERDDLDAVLKKISKPPPKLKDDLTPGGMHLARTCPGCGLQF